MKLIKNKNGDFKIEKISAAIEKAFEAQGRNYVPGVIDFLALKVTSDFEPKIKDDLIAVVVRLEVHLYMTILAVSA